MLKLQTCGIIMSTSQRVCTGNIPCMVTQFHNAKVISIIQLVKHKPLLVDTSVYEGGGSLAAVSCMHGYKQQYCCVCAPQKLHAHTYIYASIVCPIMDNIEHAIILTLSLTIITSVSILPFHMEPYKHRPLWLAIGCIWFHSYSTSNKDQATRILI